MSFTRWLFPSGYRAASHYNRGTMACHSGDWISAETHLREAVQAWHNYPEAWHNLGIALAAQGRFEDAIQAYETALWQRRNFAEAWNNFGLALAKAGRVDDAREALAESLRLKPSYRKAREDLESLGEIIERHSPAGQRDEPIPTGYRHVSLDWIAASTVDDPVSAIIDGAPEAGSPILFDHEESQMMEAELAFMVNDLYYTDSQAGSIERTLAAGGLETIALSRMNQRDFRGAMSASIKAISLESLPSSWLVLGDICEAEGRKQQASAARNKADEIALGQGTNPEVWREAHQLRRSADSLYERED